MTNIRALRLSHGLTLVDLALLTDIPVRTLAEIEHGLQRLDYESRARLARAFDTAPEQLWAGKAHPRRAPGCRAWLPRVAPALASALAGMLLLFDPLLSQLPPPSAAARAGAPTAAAARRSGGLTLQAPRSAAVATGPTARPIVAPAPPSPTQPPPAPQPRFVLAQDGPHGCPLAPAAGSVVMTQGYGVGSHEPASIWGAVDLAIDGDGDGSAEPSATQGVAVFATHGGVAHVFLDSWPAGNYVRVVDEQAGWSTAYAHLDTVLVTDGQPVPAGATIGAVGSTGEATGPHLHYEVWHGGENVDPSGLIGCG